MYCMHCGAENAENARFCMKCGQALAAATPAPAAYRPGPALTVPAGEPADEAYPDVSGGPIFVQPAAAPPAPRRRRRWPLVVGGILAAILVVAVAGVVLARTWLHIGTNDSARFMPGRTTAMMISVSPGPLQIPGLQRLQTVAAAFGAAAQSTGASTANLFDSNLDIDFQRDISPWVGFEYAAGVLDAGKSSPELLASVAVRDSGGATRFTDKLSAQLTRQGGRFATETYQGVKLTYQQPDSGGSLAYAQTNGFLLLGTSVDVLRQAVDVAQGRQPSLAAQERYSRFLSTLSGNRTGYFYTDWQAYQTLLGESTGALSTLAGLQGLETMGAALILDANGLRVDYSLTYDTSVMSSAQRAALKLPSNGNHAIAMAPEDALFYLGGQNLTNGLDQLGEMMQSGGASAGSMDMALEELGLGRDTLAWAKDEYAIVVVEDAAGLLGSKDTPINAVILLETADRAAAERSVQSIADAFGSSSGTRFVDETINGARFKTMTDPSTKGVLGIGVVKNFLVIATSRDLLTRVSAGGSSLAGSATFKKASGQLPSGNGGYTYLDIGHLAGLIYRQMPASERSDFDRNVRPYLENLQAVAATSRQPSSKEDVTSGTLYLLFSPSSGK